MYWNGTYSNQTATTVTASEAGRRCKGCLFFFGPAMEQLERNVRKIRAGGEPLSQLEQARKREDRCKRVLFLRLAHKHCRKLWHTTKVLGWHTQHTRNVFGFVHVAHDGLIKSSNTTRMVNLSTNLKCLAGMEDHTPGKNI